MEKKSLEAGPYQTLSTSFNISLHVELVQSFIANEIPFCGYQLVFLRQFLVKFCKKLNARSWLGLGMVDR